MTTVPQAAPLRADCIADSAGGLTFDVTAPDANATAHLVLRHREGPEEVTLPLAPAARGRLRAALPSSVVLPEGHWDAYASVTAEAPDHRVASGAMDVHPSASRVPYVTRQGNLSVESRLALRTPGGTAVRAAAPPARAVDGAGRTPGPPSGSAAAS
ncbi:hypothetical protein [Streptomyces sp. NPDC056628]|uniref:hypothetical protein n=1 Tax=Streptomyces sp. NPDC056628 TaxID=3345882 RepID=UPI0036784F8F